MNTRSLVIMGIVVLILIGLIATVAVLASNASKSGSGAAGLPVLSNALPRVVVSLTTTPKRLRLVWPVLKSLFEDQELKPDAIELNLPQIFKRDMTLFNDDEVAQFANLPYISINRCEDIGPITKFVPTLVKYREAPNTMVIVVDDDTLYAPSLIKALAMAAVERKDSVITAHCTSLYTTNNTGCDLLEGFKAYLLRPALFEEGFYTYLNRALKDRSCYISDDYVLSNYLHLNKIPVYRIPSLISVRQLDYGFGSDALHRQGVSDATRYCACYRHLDKLGVAALKSRCATDKS